MGIPDPGAVEKVEGGRRLLARIARIQFLDPFPRPPQQVVIPRQPLGGGIGKVGQQGKLEVRIAVAEIVDFEPFEQRVQRVRARQQRRHDDHGAVRGRDAAGAIEPR